MYIYVLLSRVHNREGECLTFTIPCVKLACRVARRVNHYKGCPSRLKYNINNRQWHKRKRSRSSKGEKPGSQPRKGVLKGNRQYNIKDTTKFIDIYQLKYSCRQSYSFIKAGSNCSAPDLKPALLLLSSLEDSWTNQSEGDCFQPLIPYLYRRWSRHCPTIINYKVAAPWR